jgi:hypothetical protein
VSDASAARWFSVFYLKGFQMKNTVMAVLLGAALGTPWPALADSAYLKVGFGQSRYTNPFATDTKSVISTLAISERVCLAAIPPPAHRLFMALR